MSQNQTPFTRFIAAVILAAAWVAFFLIMSLLFLVVLPTLFTIMLGVEIFENIIDWARGLLNLDK